jgi:two-component system CheB/CheR fusion protein
MFSRIVVCADKARIGQVLTNLLGNAAKFTDPGGRISVRLDLDAAQRARIAISDSGIGMTHETLAGVFKPFAQGDRGLDRNRWGLGLGLALARELVRLHGGDISAKSDGPDHGSEVVVVLPLETAVDLH